jgi:hypothetical protein
MTFRIHPCRQKPWQALALSAFIVAVGWFFQSCFQGYWGILAVVILSLSLRSYFFATTYIFKPETLEVRGLWHKKTARWERFKSFIVYPNGIYLSPYRKPKVWEPFRGIFLLLDKDNLRTAKQFIEAELYASNH